MWVWLVGVFAGFLVAAGGQFSLVNLFFSLLPCCFFCTGLSV